MRKDLITQDNALINASYNLDLAEKRLILLAIAKSRKVGQAINSYESINIHASEYADSFKVERQASYWALMSASESLFKRYFIYKKINKNNNEVIYKSRWISRINYVNKESIVEVIFAPDVIPFISQLEKCFTSYFLEDIAGLTSIYAIRLYELIIAWKSSHQTPVFEIKDFREKLGIGEFEYQAMNDFKKRVLNIAIKQINEHTNIQIEVEQHKRGRAISGFSFFFSEIKPKADDGKDTKTVDWVDEVDKPKRKTITKAQAEQMARVGETWSELLARLAPDYYIKGL